MFPGSRNEEETTIAKQDDAPIREADDVRTPAGGEASGESAETRALDGEKQDLGPKLKALEEENSDLKDKLLRKAADFENFRKRMFREREEAVHYANAELLKDLIGTFDDFERAIQSAGESHDFSSFLAGVELIEKQLVERMERSWSLKRFSSLGEPFDPNRHEAVLSAEGDTAIPVVAEEYQKGYFLHERLLRPAKVKVQLPRAGAGSPGGAAHPSSGTN